MPSNELLKSSGVTPNMLAPHLRKRLVGNNSSSNGIYSVIPTNEDEGQVYQLAEAIQANIPCAINQAGKIVKANYQSNPYLPVYGINKVGGATDNLTKMYNEGDIITLNNVMFTIGKYVLFSGNVDLYTTNFIYQPDSISQILGTAISTNSFRIKIEQPILMK